MRLHNGHECWIDKDLYGIGLYILWYSTKESQIFPRKQIRKNKEVTNRMKSSRKWINLKTSVRIAGNLAEVQTGYLPCSRLDHYTSLPGGFHYKSSFLFTRQGCTFCQQASLWHLAPCSPRRIECIASSHGAAVELLRTRLADYWCVCMHIQACPCTVCSFLLETSLHCLER
jgi:hypothetical protein